MAAAHDFLEIINNFNSLNIIIIGDIMLDRYVNGSVSRQSPEAPVPVLLKGDESIMPGGAANLAMNLAGLTVQTTLMGRCGQDQNARTLNHSLAQQENLQTYLTADDTCPTITKTRFLNEGTHLLRLDEEKPFEDDNHFNDAVLKTLENQAYDAIILSDYCKGTLNDALIQTIIKTAQKNKRPVYGDTKTKDLTAYQNIDGLTPNRQELEKFCGHAVHNNDEDITKAARALIKCHQIKSLLVTRSQAGASFITKNDAVHGAQKKRAVRDVSGAGDATLAGFLAARLCQATAAQALILANIIGGYCAEHDGTTKITKEILEQEINAW